MKKISGIIDASDSMSGDPMYDLGVINQHTFRRKGLMDYFFKGYGKVDTRKVNFYSLVHAIWLTNFHGLIHKNKQELKKDIDSIEYYLSLS